MADVGRHLHVPQCVAVTAIRADMMCRRIVYFMELMSPFQDAIEEAFERKKLCGTGSGSKATRLASTHKTSGYRCYRLCSKINHIASVGFFL